MTLISPSNLMALYGETINSDCDEEIIIESEEDSSSDSSVSKSKFISKSTLIPIKPCFNNPSVEQASKTSIVSKKKPCLNKKDIVHPKEEARQALAAETKSKLNVRFLEKSKKSVSQTVVHLTTRTTITL